MHGKLPRNGVVGQHGGSGGRYLGDDPSTNWFIVDESAGVCGTLYGRSGLAGEVVGQAAERRKKEWSATDFCGGIMFSFILALSIVAVAGTIMKST